MNGLVSLQSQLMPASGQNRETRIEHMSAGLPPRFVANSLPPFAQRIYEIVQGGITLA